MEAGGGGSTALLLAADGGGAGAGAGALPESQSMSAKKRAARTQLLKVLGICLVFMGCEVVGGYLAGSLAIMTDAAHLLSDAASFGISLSAVWIADRPRTARATFGFHRVEIVGAMASVLLIWVLTAALCVEAVMRVIKPEPVDGKIMFITACGGLVVNLLMMRVLHGGGGEEGGGGSHHGHSHAGGGHGHSHGAKRKDGGEGGAAAAAPADQNYSIRAAYIHILGDLVQTIGVIIASVIIWAVPEWHVADPICTFTFSVLVLFTTFQIVASAYHSLLNSVPEGLDLARLAADLRHLPAVRNVHDLHVWSFGQDRLCLTAHAIVRGGERERSAVLEAASAVAAKLGIRHSTFQIELESSAEVDACLRFNEHVDECSLSLQDPDTTMEALFTVARPLGSRTPGAPTPKPDDEECGGGGHGHSHAGGGHGHSHAGGDHGHAH